MWGIHLSPVNSPHKGHWRGALMSSLICAWTNSGLFRCKSKKTSKFRVTGLCAGSSPVTGEFTAQRASNAENVSIWWRHHELEYLMCLCNKLNSLCQLKLLLCELKYNASNFIIKFALMSTYHKVSSSRLFDFRMIVTTISLLFISQFHPQPFEQW